MTLSIHNKIDYLFLFLLLPFFVLGVPETNYLIGTYLIYFIIFRNKNLFETFNNHKYLVIIFFSLYSVLILSSLLSNHTIYSLESSLFYFLYLIYIFSILIIFQSNEKIEVVFLFFGIFVVFILSIDGLYEFLFGKNIIGLSGQYGRIAGFFNDRWVIGIYILKLLPLLIGIYLVNINFFMPFQRNLIYLSLLAGSFMIVLSGERKAFLLLILYSCLMGIYFFRYIGIKKFFIFITIFFVVITSPFIFSSSNSRMTYQVKHHLTNLNVFENQYFALYSTSVNMFLDKPLLGIGPNVFRKECFDRKYVESYYSCSTHPHNYVLQLLSEIGLIGFCLVYSIYAYFIFQLFKLLKRKKNNNHDFGLYSIICSLIVNFWPLIPTANFFLSWNGFLSFLPISLYLYYTRLNKIDV